MATLEQQGLDVFKDVWAQPQTMMFMVCRKHHMATYGVSRWFHVGDVVRFADCVMVVTGVTVRGAEKPYDWPRVFGPKQNTLPYWTLYESDQDVPARFRPNLSQPVLTFECNGPR